MTVGAKVRLEFEDSRPLILPRPLKRNKDEDRVVCTYEVDDVKKMSNHLGLAFKDEYIYIRDDLILGYGVEEH